MSRVVAEAGQTMQGDVDLAIFMAEAAASAGAWGFKTQLLKPETIAQPNAPLYWRDDLGNRHQREAFTRAGLVDYGAWREVADACSDFGIEFLATPFDLDAVDALADIVAWFKIASGDITYRQLIRAVDATGGNLILSTGAATFSEIDQALGWCDTARVTLLACTLSYPTPPSAAHLARIERLHREFCLPVGYSDHTSLPETGMCAAALGSVLNEVHYTHNVDGDDVPDHRMALDPKGLEAYVGASELGTLLRGSPILAPCAEEEDARHGARRSVCANRDLPAGHVLTTADFAYLRPGGGLDPYEAEMLEGVTLATPVGAGERLS